MSCKKKKCVVILLSKSSMSTALGKHKNTTQLSRFILSVQSLRKKWTMSSECSVSFIVLLQTVSSFIFVSFLLVLRLLRLSTRTPPTIQEKETESQIPIWVHRPSHRHFCLSWVASSGPCCNIDLLTSVRVLDQAISCYTAKRFWTLSTRDFFFYFFF